MITHSDYDNYTAFTTLMTTLKAEDVSYRNDTCPSLKADNFQIFVDYKNPEMREDEGLSEFYIIPRDENFEEEVGEGIEAHSVEEVIKIVKSAI